MNTETFPPENARLRLKEPIGWWAAGESFRNALTALSDGGFKLFAYLCLQADRRTGRFQATQRELAAALGKSRRILGTYVAELQAKAICNVRAGKNQFAPTIFEISDAYWPYHRSAEASPPAEEKTYVTSVREWFLGLGCAKEQFGAADVETARTLQHRGIALAVVQDALLVGACRKWTSWLNGAAPEPIGSLRYFEPLIAELLEQPFPPGYSSYLRRKNEQFAQTWKESVRSSAHSDSRVKRTRTERPDPGMP